jgi:hypothetical protein
MITIAVERVGDVTDSAHLTIEPGQVIRLTLTAHDDGPTAAEVLAACTDRELAAEVTRRLEAR